MNASPTEERIGRPAQVIRHSSQAKLRRLPGSTPRRINDQPCPQSSCTQRRVSDKSFAQHAENHGYNSGRGSALAGGHCWRRSTSTEQSDAPHQEAAVAWHSRQPPVNINAVDGDARCHVCLCGLQCSRSDGSRTLRHRTVHNDSGNIRRILWRATECARATAAALRVRAPLTTSRGYTEVWVSVPRKSSAASMTPVARVQVHDDEHLVLQAGAVQAQPVAQDLR